MADGGFTCEEKAMCLIVFSQTQWKRKVSAKWGKDRRKAKEKGRGKALGVNIPFGNV